MKRCLNMACWHERFHAGPCLEAIRSGTAVTWPGTLPPWDTLQGEVARFNVERDDYEKYLTEWHSCHVWMMSSTTNGVAKLEPVIGLLHGLESRPVDGEPIQLRDGDTLQMTYTVTIE